MKIILVDDDKVILDTLSVIFSKYSDIEIVKTFDDANDALRYIKENAVDIVLMDIEMPEMSGIDACYHMLKIKSNLKIIMLTTFHDYKNIHQSLKAGAVGYLLKTDPEDKQVATIKAVHGGLPIISLDALKSFSSDQELDMLTTRENDVLKAIAEGLSNREIAIKHYLSEGTVRNIVTIILEKLELRDRTQLAIYYWQKVKS